MIKDNAKNDAFSALLEKEELKIPQVGDIVKGLVIAASKAEVRLDIDGVMTGIVRGPELYLESEEYTNLEPGKEVEAMVVDAENEDGELELSFRQVGQGKAWDNLRDAFKTKTTVFVKVADANKGGLLCSYRQISGFLPVSQLAPENYPRISGGDKSKILEKLKSFMGQEFEVNVITLNEDEGKIIFSEKDVWNKKQKPILEKYKVNMVVEGKITAVTNFGVFVSFDDNIEGLIHISELAWQRIDSPSTLYKVGDKIKAEIVNIDGNKIFLSAKKIMKDPWLEAVNKYTVGQGVKGSVLKVNPFGLFVKLDDDIHGLAHITQLGLSKTDKINDLFKLSEEREFEILSISPSDHRLALKLLKDGKKEKSVKKEETEKPAKKVKKEESEEEAEKEDEAKPAKKVKK
ncbi:30S ribosomal protein S1 [Candidatus Falkowbacteria bacterium CG10_big_fil_rev_8_21_14_0_10_39_9]|uniref:30S ribosomal protein S1 n=1 Tax=Candidatus Falkowbacteria bacterium CG10_big_fil_rev_8_21_14_0_10_39_9 TaxID=1974566 RepID=A0A2M6WR79_9BACT|nr:MAG: 30S ribosomal protein S1 [Candidatus Falkowbacteria bacterium CG10_big_fil_rev_8_21_14_0_10_39_9]